MKLKAVVTRELQKNYPDLVWALQAIWPVIEMKVLIPILKMKPNVGPAEAYLQESDVAVTAFAFEEDPGFLKELNVDLEDIRSFVARKAGRNLGVEIRLTGVSVNTDRATGDFWRALTEIERIYETVIRHYVQQESVQLFCSLMLDQKPFGLKTTLLETEPKWTRGEP